MAEKQTTEKVYKEISHTWHDLWEERDITVAYRFSKPSPADIKRMQAGAVKNAGSASRQILMDTVHPDDKEKMLADLQEYPALASTISSAIIRSCGVADLGN
jgi:hypothetical protein